MNSQMISFQRNAPGTALRRATCLALFFAFWAGIRFAAWGADLPPKPIPVHLPPLCPDGIPLARLFEKQVLDRSIYGANIKWIWGADSPFQPHRIMPSLYFPINVAPRENPWIHNMDWYLKNHPDWIMYQADESTPGYGFMYPYGGRPPFDISNPEMRDFYLHAFILPRVTEGYPMIDLDIVEFANIGHRVGHFDKAGKWVPMFTGKPGDPAYADSQIGFMDYLVKELHPWGIGIAANISFNTASVDVIRRAVNTVDMWGDEGGFFHKSDPLTDDDWAKKFAFMSEVLPNKAYVGVNKFESANATPEQMEWIISNFLLVRGPRSLLGLGYARFPLEMVKKDPSHDRGTVYGTFDNRPELRVNIGKPSGAAVKATGQAWMRKYEHGIVYVNPSSKETVTLQLPEGKWLDMKDHTVERELKLGPAAGAVLRDSIAIGPGPMPTPTPPPIRTGT